LKNALARGTPEYRKWHPGWETLASHIAHARVFCAAHDAFWEFS